jgi:hypothetical protein
VATKPSGKASKAKRLRPVGLVLQAEDGTMYVAPVTVTPEKPKKKGGRPLSVARDVSIVLHYEYLVGFDGMTPAQAHKQLAIMFPRSDESRLPSLIKSARERYLKDFRQNLTAQGLADHRGNVVGRLLATFEAADAVTIEIVDGKRVTRVDGRGFICRWKDREAIFGTMRTGEPAPDGG